LGDRPACKRSPSSTVEASVEADTPRSNPRTTRSRPGWRASTRRSRLECKGMGLVNLLAYGRAHEEVPHMESDIN